MPDYAHLIAHPGSIAYAQAAEYICEFPEEIEILYRYLTNGNITERKRSAWILEHVSNTKASVFTPWHSRWVAHAPNAKTDAEKRFISRLFANHGLPEGEELQGVLMQQAFDWLLDPKESIAVKVHCLSILHRFSKVHPELENELRAIITDQWPKSTAAFRSRAKHILKDLNLVTGRKSL